MRYIEVKEFKRFMDHSTLLITVSLKMAICLKRSSAKPTAVAKHDTV